VSVGHELADVKQKKEKKDTADSDGSPPNLSGPFLPNHQGVDDGVGIGPALVVQPQSQLPVGHPHRVGADGELVIHAMDLRTKYRSAYDAAKEATTQ